MPCNLVHYVTRYNLSIGKKLRPKYIFMNLCFNKSTLSGLTAVVARKPSIEQRDGGFHRASPANDVNKR